MHVLVGRGGDLAAPFGPVCDDTDCICHHGLAGLESLCPVELITVADRDMTPEQLTAACAGFLYGARWDDDNGELAHDMAQLAADMAAAYPVGTALRVRFDHADQCWMSRPDPIAAQSL